MKTKNHLLILACLVVSGCGKTDARTAETVDAVTGATPLALARPDRVCATQSVNVNIC